MAIAYIIVSLFIVLKNINYLPSMFRLIFKNAFGFNQVLGGGIGAALMQGIKRVLFVSSTPIIPAARPCGQHGQPIPGCVV